LLSEKKEIAKISAGKGADQLEAGAGFGGQILPGVHHEVGAVLQEILHEIFGEHAPFGQFPEGVSEVLVAQAFFEKVFDLERGVGGDKGIAHGESLKARQMALARGDPKGFHAKASSQPYGR
jgi:hypothetical protein